jgi:polyhydroxybutyrate depolymerase
MKKFVSILCLCAAVFTGACSLANKGTAGGSTLETIVIDSAARNYILYLPTGWKDLKNMPLLIALHGHGGTAEGMERLTGFAELGEKEKFIVVYPDGVDRSWNDGRDKLSKVDDVKFIKNLMLTLLSKYAIDGHKVYVTGMSNGGFMTMRLACELSDKLAAVAAVGATTDESVDVNCQSANPLSVLLIHGNKDPVVPFDGGFVKRFPESPILSHQESISRWVHRNKCKEEPSVTIIPDKAHDDTYIIKTDYAGGINSTEVVSYVIDNGGHNWPGTTLSLPIALTGRTSHNLDATQVIWDFFKAHPKL